MIPPRVSDQTVIFTYFWQVLRLGLLLVGLTFGSPGISWSQHPPCNVDERFFIDSSLSYYQDFLNRIYPIEQRGRLQSRTTMFLPVVVHVVYRDGFKPVSRAQVLQQLDVLNADFSGRGENISKVPVLFRSLVNDTGIRFCLADQDPEGAPSDGITYTVTDVPDIALQTGPGGRLAIHYDQLGGKSGWDPARYINIWIGEYGTLLGSATFPGMASKEEEIGVIVDIRYFGALGDAAHSGFFSRGHTLTHEMGHFFGLRHIWGEGLSPSCDDSDDIDDTPNAAGPYFGCPSGEQMTCGSADMYHNFMDFTDDRCLAFFTPLQSQRMRTVLGVYYPDLEREGSCHVPASSFNQWYESLIWSFDAESSRYVIYHPDALSGRKEVRVFSMDGKLVHHGTWHELQPSYLLDMEFLPFGVYAVSLKHEGVIRVRKIVGYLKR